MRTPCHSRHSRTLTRPSLPFLAAMILMAVVMTAALTGPASAQCVSMVAYLEGDQVDTPGPLGVPGIGTGHFLIDTDANTLDYEIRYGGLTAAETNAHIHGPAGPGVGAGVLHPLPAGSPKIGRWNYPESAEADILGGSTYVNVHTANWPAGEIRGQIVSQVASLTGDQAGIATSATGTGLFVIDTDANTLRYHITFAGLQGTETMAHIHGNSVHTVGSGILHGLSLGSPKVGVWNYMESNEDDILNGRTYVNIHTDVAPGGEIRGQITNFVTTLDADQQGGTVTSSAIGVGFFSLDTVADLLGYDVRFFGLGSPENAAHIHGYAPRGQSAQPLLTLSAGTPKIGTWNYPAANEGNVLADQTYINIHTDNNPGGEIRGQVDLTGCPDPTAVGDWREYR